MLRAIVMAALALASPLLTVTAALANDARLGRGEIIVSTRAVAGSDMPEATVQAVIDAPADRVWRIIDDCAGYKRTMPRIKASRLVERSGSRVICEITVEMPFPFANLTAVSDGHHVVGPPSWSRTWKLIRGDYHKNVGSWTLTPFDAAGTRTRAVYRLHVEPKVSIPGAVLRRAQASALPEVMERLRESVR